MAQQKSINNKIEHLNMYYKYKPHAWSNKRIKNSHHYPFLIPKTNTYTVPTVFIIFIAHIVLGCFPLQAFICFVFIINCGVMTIIETTCHHAWQVRSVQLILLPTTDV